MKLGYKSISTIAMAEVYYNGTHFNIENLANIANCLDINVSQLLLVLNDIVKNSTTNLIVNSQ